MGAYYNEYDPGAAAWLRELIRRGLIADGEVDERSILEVAPDDLRGFTQVHCFAGIGGWSYALRLAGWPDDEPVWTGSPPCQPFSSAGRQKGKDDERHLAPHFVSLVRACRPAVLFGEQVASAAVFGPAPKGTRPGFAGTPPWAWLDDLSDRLEAARYAVGASDIPAAGVGAPHIRQRTFFGAVRLADANSGEQGVVGSSGGRVAGGQPRDAWLGHWSGGGDVGLADAERIGSPLGLPAAQGRHERDADVSGDSGSGQLRSGAGRSEDVGLEHTSRDGRDERRAGADGRGLAAGCGVGGVAKPHSGERDRLADGQGRQPNGPTTGREQGDGQSEPHCDAGGPRTPDSPWRDADWLFCRDGRWRPVESGTFPLVDGVPARVGRLRGYGNAIVPQAAAEFIQAFSAAAQHLRLNPVSEMTQDKDDIFG